MDATTKMRHAAYRGALLSSSGHSLAAIWRTFHDNTYLILRFAHADTSRGDGSTMRTIADAESQLLRMMDEIAAADWIRFCTGAGWTETGAALLSWCKDARGEDVWRGFAHAGEWPVADEVFERAARLVKPKALPTGLTLSAVVASANGSHHAICAALVARRGTIRIDYPPAQIAQMPEVLQHYVASNTAGNHAQVSAS